MAVYSDILEHKRRPEGNRSMRKRPNPTRPKRQTLTRERVLRAALALADERGIDALSMRELGRRLGVDAMSLYNHVENKVDLLDGIVDLMVGEIDLPAGEDDWTSASPELDQKRRGIEFEGFPYFEAGGSHSDSLPRVAQALPPLHNSHSRRGSSERSRAVGIPRSLWLPPFR